MRTVRILSLLMGCYLVGWVTADMLVPLVLAHRDADQAASSTSFVSAEGHLLHHD